MLALIAALIGIVFIVLGFAHVVTAFTALGVGLICLLSITVLSFVGTRVGPRV